MLGKQASRCGSMHSTSLVALSLRKLLGKPVEKVKGQLQVRASRQQQPEQAGR